MENNHRLLKQLTTYMAEQELSCSSVVLTQPKFNCPKALRICWNHFKDPRQSFTGPSSSPPRHTTFPCHLLYTQSSAKRTCQWWGWRSRMTKTAYGEGSWGHSLHRGHASGQSFPWARLTQQYGSRTHARGDLTSSIVHCMLLMEWLVGVRQVSNPPHTIQPHTDNRGCKIVL